MYTCQIRVYEISDRTRYYAELYQGEPDAAGVMATAHLDLPRLPPSPVDHHEQMMDAIRLVCTELAQNFDVPMF